MEKGGKAQRRKPPPPPAAAKCLTSCLRRACDVRATKGRRQGRPPPPHTSAPPRVGDEGRGGRKAPPPPPEDKAAGWGGSGERVRDGPHDRARREHAPCKPQRGDHRGCERRVGRATTGATRQAPPPLQRDKCRASCLRRACDVLTPEDRQRGRPPHPTPFSPTHPGKGRGQRGDGEGTWGGGAGDRPKRRGERRAASGGDARQPEPPPPKKKASQRARAGTDSRDGRDTAGTRERGKERGKGGHPLGRKRGGRGPTPQRTGGGRGASGAPDVKWPQSRVVKNPCIWTRLAKYSVPMIQPNVADAAKLQTTNSRTREACTRIE